MSQKAKVAVISAAALAAASGLSAYAYNAEQFHPLNGLTKTEAEAGDVREFKGDGTAYLKVPGLVSISSVRVGTLEIPLTIEQEFPIDSTGRKTETVTTPLVALVDSPSDGMILMRSVQSNDGIWQDGAPIFVKGEWEPELSPFRDEAPAAADDKASV